MRQPQKVLTRAIAPGTHPVATARGTDSVGRVE